MRGLWVTCSSRRKRKRSSSGLVDVYLLAEDAFYAIDNIGGSECDFNRSLRSCYFVCVVNERASFAYFAVEVAW